MQVSEGKAHLSIAYPFRLDLTFLYGEALVRQTVKRLCVIVPEVSPHLREDSSTLGKKMKFSQLALLLIMSVAHLEERIRIRSFQSALFLSLRTSRPVLPKAFISILNSRFHRTPGLSPSPYPQNLHEYLTAAVPVVVVEDYDLLPGSQNQLAAVQRHGHARTHKAGPHVGETVGSPRQNAPRRVRSATNPAHARPGHPCRSDRCRPG